MLKLLRAVRPRFFSHGIVKPNPPNGPSRRPIMRQWKREIIGSDLFDDFEEHLYGGDREKDKFPVRCKDTNGIAHEVLVRRNVSTPLTCEKQFSSSLVSNCALAIATYPSGLKEKLSPTNRLTEPCEIELINIYPPRKEYAGDINLAILRSAAVLASAAISKTMHSVPFVNPFFFDNEKDEYFSLAFPSETAPSEKEFDEVMDHVADYMKSNAVFENLVVPDELRSDFDFPPGARMCRLGDRAFIVDGPTIASPSQICGFFLIPGGIRSFEIEEAKFFKLTGMVSPAAAQVSTEEWLRICEKTNEKLHEEGLRESE